MTCGPADADLADLAERQIVAVVVADGDLGRGQRQADRAGELAVELNLLAVATGEVSVRP